MLTPKEKEIVQSLPAIMNADDVIRELDDAIVIAKDQARQCIAQELQEFMRQRVPQFCKRLEKDLDEPSRGPCDTVRKAIATTFIENRSLTGRIILEHIGKAHLIRFLHRQMADRIKRLSVIHVAEAVDDLMEIAKIMIPLYPEIARPRLPRRSDVSRMLGRFCGCTRKL